MAKYLTLDERNIIAQRLAEGCSFKAIANELGKNCTTISREVQNHNQNFLLRSRDCLTKALEIQE